MGTLISIAAPKNEADIEGAKCAFKDFLTIYASSLGQVETYLGNMVYNGQPVFGHAYQPWLRAVHSIIKSAQLIEQGLPVAHPKLLAESLRMFSFQSTAQFLQDICICCTLKLEHHWVRTFQHNINILLFSMSIILRHQQATKEGLIQTPKSPDNLSSH